MDDDTQGTGNDAPAVADTVDTQATEASDQTNNEAPEATQTQEDTSEVKATDTAEEKLLAGKYKTVEDLEKAYKNAETKLHTEASEKAELTRILNQSFTPAEQSEAPVDDFADESPVNQEIENLKRVTAVQSFVMGHQDADGEAMNKVLSEDPLVKQILGHEAKLEYAYLRSQNMTQHKAIAEAEKRGAQQTQAKVAEKQVAQVETATKTAETTDETSELRTRATGNYTQSERDAARLALIRKTLVDI